METIWMIQKAIAMGNWWLAASSWQCSYSCITSRVKFFVETSNHPDDSTPYSPDLVPCNFWLFPKQNHLWKGRDIRPSVRFRKIWWGQLMVIGRTVWGPKVPTLKGTEESLSYVPCFFYLVSSSINVSNFYLTWLRTFWTDLIHQGTDRRTSVILYSSWHLTVILNEVESNWRILTRGVLWSDLYFDKSILAAVLRIDWGAQE